jgi:hypothetical protein
MKVSIFAGILMFLLSCNSNQQCAKGELFTPDMVGEYDPADWELVDSNRISFYGGKAKFDCEAKQVAEFMPPQANSKAGYEICRCRGLYKMKIFLSLGDTGRNYLVREYRRKPGTTPKTAEGKPLSIK